MLGVVTVGLLCALVCQYVASVASQGFGTEVRNALFIHIQSLSHREMDQWGTPSLINRVTNDVNQLQYAVAMLIRLVMRAPFLCIGGIVMAMTIDLPLSLVIIIAIPLFVAVITLVMRKTIPLQRGVQRQLDRLTLVLVGKSFRYPGHPRFFPDKRGRRNASAKQWRSTLKRRFGSESCPLCSVPRRS